MRTLRHSAPYSDPAPTSGRTLLLLICAFSLFPMPASSGFGQRHPCVPKVGHAPPAHLHLCALNTRPIAGESATAAEAGCQEQHENQLHSKVGPEGFRRLCQQPSRQGRAPVRAPTATSPSSTLPGMACRRPGRPSGFAPASTLTAGLMSQK